MRRAMAALTVFIALLPSNLRAADLLVDHVEYIRATGAAQQMSLFFPGCDTQGTYTLTVKNGQDEAHRATVGSVSVNGAELVGAADFMQSPAPALITRTIETVAERNTIALSAAAPQGSVIGWQVTAEVSCPDITIVSPVAGEVFNRGEITVTGKVRHRTPEVGVIVNGVVAQVNGNDWAANGVELAAGGNTLTATATDENDQSWTASMIVSRLDIVAPGVTLKAYGASGVTPLEVSFALENHTDKQLAQYTVDYGDGVTETKTEFAAMRHTYTSEGIFQAIVTATDAQGVEYRDSTAISAHPFPPLRTRWEKMKVALAVGAIGQATLNFTTQEARAQQEIFGSMAAQMQAIVAEMQDIQLVYLDGDRAKFRIRRNELIDGVETAITYYIYFIRNRDGFWKIDSF